MVHCAPRPCQPQKTIIPSARVRNHPTDLFVPEGSNGESNGFFLIEQQNGSPCQFFISTTGTVDQQLTAFGSAVLSGNIDGDCADDQFNWQFVFGNNGPGPAVDITLPQIKINDGYPCDVTYTVFHAVYDKTNNQLSYN